MQPVVRLFIVASCLICAVGAPALAEEPKRPWTDVADLGLIVTSGNSKTFNVAAANKFVYTWAKSDFTLDAAALRTETTDRTLSNPAGVVVDTGTKRATAESYAVAGKYRMSIREGFLWYAQAGWNRNRFSGFANRYFAGAGVGHRFIKDDRNLLAGELGVNYNRDSYIADSIPDSANFADLRAFLAYEYKISDTAKFNDDFELLENLSDTSDLRAKNVAAVVASLTKKVALKASLALLYDNQPVEVLVAPDTIGFPFATFRYDKLDTIVSASFVINF